MTSQYLIYGANGYTGELVAREAKARGQEPILSGRNAASVSALAGELGLAWRAFDLADPAAIDAGLAGVGAVLNCAGPFVRTARPWVDACLRARAHYLDVTGEIDVFEALAARDGEARAAGIALLPGVGFDVVPTDCLAAHLKRRLPNAVQLHLGLQALMELSRGTAVTTIEAFGKPNLVRRNGLLTAAPFGASTRVIDFGRGRKTAVSIPWGDVSTAYHSTGIPNIEVFVAVPDVLRHAMKWNDALAPVLRSRRVRNALQALVRAGKPGPDATARARGRSYLWGEACDAAGSCVSTRLETPEGYTLTVQTALAAVNKLLAGPAPTGFQTPSRAFGPDFILEMPNVTRTDL